jgi:aspartyl-tRNA(Asn)/glutamyl-tRNA(Gln) amidotransferase subunit A
MSDLLSVIKSQSASEQIAAIKAGELDARELFEAYRQRAAADEHNAFTWVSEVTPVSIPEATSPLAGLPVAVKDLFCTAGVPTQSGSKLLEGYLPPYTSTAVAKLEQAGATMHAKTNQDEFAMGSSNENSAFGAVKNPWDPARVPGGSSGGSAAAVAAGHAPWALGTDTGGSIRQPAALCGLVGLKPTYGAISRYGMIAFASSLDQAGPITRTVADAALMLRHLHGADDRDMTSVGLREEIEIPTRESLEGLVIGVPESLLAEGLEPGVLASFRAALAQAESLGARLEEIELPHAEAGLSAYYVLAPAEASSNLSRFDGVRYGNRIEDEDGTLMGMYTRTRHDGFGPEVKRRIMLGTYALSAGYYDAYYGTAQRVRTKIAGDFKAAFDQVDVIATPTSPTVAWELGAKVSDPLAMYLSDVFTIPMSLAGIPGINIPSGLSDGLPVGLQLAGPAFSENLILGVAHALERTLGFDTGGAIR